MLAQTPQEAFAAARAVVQAHSSDGVYLDNTAETFAATRQMWSALAASLIAERERDPNRTAAALDQTLCLLTTEPAPPETATESCAKPRAPQVLALSTTVLLVAPTVGPVGTAFLLGYRNQHLDVVWSIDDPSGTPLTSSDQPEDRQLALEAWLPNRIAADCRDGERPHPALACGPLAPHIGRLPDDVNGHPRFYVDATYSQPTGATIAHQASIWTWRGASATLEWLTTYSANAGQPGVSFDTSRNTLVLPQKGFFRIMSECAECLARPLEQRILLTPEGAQDLGARSQVPEMDAIDEFFWRLAHYESTRGIASFPPTFELRNKVRRATDESQKIGPDFYSIGMVTGTITATKAGAHVCLVTDTLGPMNVSLRRTDTDGFVITHIAKSAKITCPEGDPDGEAEVASK